jgi:hypothetical protein
MDEVRKPRCDNLSKDRIVMFGVIRMVNAIKVVISNSLPTWDVMYPAVACGEILSGYCHLCIGSVLPSELISHDCKVHHYYFMRRSSVVIWNFFRCAY